MATEQDPSNNEISQSQEQQTLADFTFEVARGLEDIVLGAYTPAELNDLVIESLRNNQTEFNLKTVVTDGSHYWLLTLSHQNRSLTAENRNLNSGTFYKTIGIDLLSDLPGGRGVTGHRFMLIFRTGAQASDATDLYATEGYSTEITGSPKVIYNNDLLTDINTAIKLCREFEQVLSAGDNPEVYVSAKKAERLINRHSDYFNL